MPVCCSVLFQSVNVCSVLLSFVREDKMGVRPFGRGARGGDEGL